METIWSLVECFLCPKKVLSRKDYETHLESDHNVSNPKETMQMLKIRRDNLEKVKEIKTETVNDDHDSTNHVKEKILNGDASDNDEFKGVSWYNRVKYECAKCKRAVFGKINLTSHLSTKHNIRKKEEIQRNCRLLSKGDRYECKICNSALKMEYSLIKYHMESVHRTNIYK